MTRSKLATMKLMLVLLTVVPLAGCEIGDVFKIFAGPPVTRVVTIVECPQLDAPPAAVTDALEAALDDPEAAAWVDSLDRHYQKLETCQ